MRRDKPGAKFHQLIALIEKAAAADSALTVRAPHYLVDRDTGRRREHDIVIVYSRQHHKLTTALECRDRSRPIGVPDVEAFAKKCERTGVNRGLIVSSSGFCKTAITKANELGIGCMNLNVAEQFDWCLLTHLTQRSTHIEHINIYACVEQDVGRDTKLFASGDIEINQETLLKVANHYFYSSPDIAALQVGKHRHTLRDQSTQLLARNTHGEETAVKHIDFTYTFEHFEKLQPAKLRSYIDAATGEVSAQVVSFEIQVKGFAGNLSIVKDGSDTMKVMLAARKL